MRAQTPKLQPKSSTIYCILGWFHCAGMWFREKYLLLPTQKQIFSCYYVRAPFHLSCMDYLLKSVWPVKQEVGCAAAHLWKAIKWFITSIENGFWKANIVLCSITTSDTQQFASLMFSFTTSQNMAEYHWSNTWSHRMCNPEEKMWLR